MYMLALYGLSLFVTLLVVIGLFPVLAVPPFAVFLFGRKSGQDETAVDLPAENRNETKWAPRERPKKAA